ncbi:MAG: protein kinase [Planctomycetota bacterium]
MSGAEGEVAADADAPGEEGLASKSTIMLALTFGQALVQQGYATKEQVDEAVALQQEMFKRGVFLRLGELLVARGVLGPDTVTEALKLQGTAILVCSSCQAQYNVLAYQANKRYRCQRCREVLSRPAQLEEVSVEDTLVAEEWREAYDAEELQSGHTLGDYAILGRISRGGMGIVYKARQQALDRVVAMKVLVEGGEEAREAFRREARALASLRHPYIVAVYDIGEANGIAFFTMDYVEGLPINRAAASEGLNEREVVEAFVKVCDAVSYAQSRGLLHRDLKPANILLDRERTPILIDFGIARAHDESEDGSTIMGSPAYLPPEYVSGSRPYDRTGEVYALGATLYTLLAGRPPREGVDSVQVLRSARLEPVQHISSVRRTLPRDLATIVMTALAQDPLARYPTVEQLGQDLRRWLEGDEIAAAAGPLARAWSRMRGRVAATIGLAVALILPILTGYFTWSQRMLERQLREAEEQAQRGRDTLLRELISSQLALARAHEQAGRLDQALPILDRLLERGGLGERRAEVEALAQQLRARANH